MVFIHRERTKTVKIYLEPIVQAVVQAEMVMDTLQVMTKFYPYQVWVRIINILIILGLDTLQEMTVLIYVHQAIVYFQLFLIMDTADLVALHFLHQLLLG